MNYRLMHNDEPINPDHLWIEESETIKTYSYENLEHLLSDIHYKYVLFSPLRPFVTSGKILVSVLAMYGLGVLIGASLQVLHLG